MGARAARVRIVLRVTCVLYHCFLFRLILFDFLFDFFFFFLYRLSGETARRPRCCFRRRCCCCCADHCFAFRVVGVVSRDTYMMLLLFVTYYIIIKKKIIIIMIRAYKPILYYVKQHIRGHHGWPSLNSSVARFRWFLPPLLSAVTGAASFNFSDTNAAL